MGIHPWPIRCSLGPFRAFFSGIILPFCCGGYVWQCPARYPISSSSSSAPFLIREAGEWSGCIMLDIPLRFSCPSISSIPSIFPTTKFPTWFPHGFGPQLLRSAASMPSVSSRGLFESGLLWDGREGDDWARQNMAGCWLGNT